jgi:hypothetical protein
VRRLLPYARPAGGLVLLAAGLGLSAGSRLYLVQVLGMAALILGIAALVQALAPCLDRSAPWPGRLGGPAAAPSWRRVVHELAGPLTLVGLITVMYLPLVRGQMPWQADHTVHLSKAWLLAEQLLPSGRIMGWTHHSGSGYPAEVLYPPLGDLLLAGLRYATFQQLSWESTYAYGFLGIITFCVLAYYAIGRRLAGGVAGFVAAFLVLTDVGGFREGGYVFTIQYGVWPLHLGVTLSLLALASFLELGRRPPGRGVIRLALLIGAALLSHPVSLIFLALALPTAGLLRWLRRAESDPPLLGRSLAAVALGLGLAAFWLLPFNVLAPRFSAHVTNQWLPIAEIASGVVNADLWRGAWAWPLVLGGLGGAVACRERRPAATILFALSAVILLVASLTLYNETAVATWLASARFIQFQRFVIFVKGLWFLLAGFLVQRLFRGLAAGAHDHDPGRDAPPPAPEAPASPGRRYALGLVAALVAAPFVVPLAWQVGEGKLLPVTGLTSPADLGRFPADLRAVLGRVCAEARRPGAPFFRLGHLSSFNDHELALAPIHCPVPEAKLTFIPSETFIYRAHLAPAAIPHTAADLRALNVRYLIGNGTHAPPPFVREVLRRGRVALYEVPDYAPERYTLVRRVSAPGETERFEAAPPEAAAVRVTHWSDERIALQVAAAAPDTFLVLHVAHFAAWEARAGGRALPIAAHDLTERVRGLMRVPLRTGTLELRYTRGWSDVLGKALTLLALAVLILIVVARRRADLRAGLAARLGPPVARLAPWARRAALGLLLVGLAALAAKATGVLPRKPGPRSLTHALARADVHVRQPDGRIHRCDLRQMGRAICGKGRRWVGPVAEEWNLRNRFGLWAHPDERGTLVIAFPHERLGRSLEIEYGILQSGGTGAPVTLDVLVGAEKLGQVTWPRSRGPASWAPAPLRLDTSAWRGRRATVRFEVSTPNIGGRHFVFDARVVP